MNVWIKHHYYISLSDTYLTAQNLFCIVESSFKLPQALGLFQGWLVAREKLWFGESIYYNYPTCWWTEAFKWHFGHSSISTVLPKQNLVNKNLAKNNMVGRRFWTIQKHVGYSVAYEQDGSAPQFFRIRACHLPHRRWTNQGFRLGTRQDSALWCRRDENAVSTTIRELFLQMKHW